MGTVSSLVAYLPVMQDLQQYSAAPLLLPHSFHLLAAASARTASTVVSGVGKQQVL
jgi:hypothetical protein